MARRPAIPFILVTVLIDVMGIGLLLPVLPALVGEFTVSRDAQTYWYGALMFTFGLAQFLCAPLLGALSDRYGRRPVLLAAISGLGTMFFLSAIVTSLPALLATRVLGGALAANFSVANAYVADITSAEARTASFGKIGAAFGIGFIIGPALGGTLGSIDIRLPFYAAAALALINATYGFFVLPESLPRDRRSPIDWRKANPFVSLAGLARLKAVGALVAVIGLVNLAQFILHGVWVLYTGFRFDWGPIENGLSLFVVGLTSALMQGVLLGRLLGSLGERRVVIAGLISGFFAFVSYGLSTAGWLMYAIIGANLLAFAVPPALNAIVSRAAGPRAQGLAMGALASLGSLTAVIAPMVGAPLLAAVSHLPSGDWRIGAPFFVSAALQALAFVLALRHFRRHPHGAGPHVARV
jgi:DHA1 family tetracycline resistance protein-like MFS transporter